jgi:hypothetical protein
MRLADAVTWVAVTTITAGRITSGWALVANALVNSFLNNRAACDAHRSRYIGARRGRVSWIALTHLAVAFSTDAAFDSIAVRGARHCDALVF